MPKKKTKFKHFHAKKQKKKNEETNLIQLRKFKHAPPKTECETIVHWENDWVVSYLMVIITELIIK